jgi:hypothetical protein
MNPRPQAGKLYAIRERFQGGIPMDSRVSCRSARAPVFVPVLLTILALAGCGGGDKPSTSSLDGAAANLGDGSGSAAVSEDGGSAAVSDTAAGLEAPVLVLTPRPIKTFHFTWDEVSDATGYNLLEDPDGVSGYNVIAAFGAGATSYDHEVFLPGRINARYVLEACNADGCTDSAPVSVSGTLAGAVGYFKASNTDAGDEFGGSVALSADGNTLAVGARVEDGSATGINGNQADNSAFSSGAVYVFTRKASGMPWKQQAYVKASNTGKVGNFGQSIALAGDGDTLAVGAPGESSNATGINGDQADSSALFSGAVYVFHRVESIWSQQAYVKASNTGGPGSSDPSAGDEFGDSVALSADGHTLAVGAPRESSNATGINGDQADNSVPFSGAVYVFQRNETGWTQQAYIKASNTGASDIFGWGIALSADGNTLAVSTPSEGSNAIGLNGNQADNSADESGAVYVFTRSGTVWGQQAYVKASNTDRGDMFGGYELGGSVALAGDGNTLAVGAQGESSNATGINGNQADNSALFSGAVYLF